MGLVKLNALKSLLVLTFFYLFSPPLEVYGQKQHYFKSKGEIVPKIPKGMPFSSRLFRSPLGHSLDINSLSFSHDGALLASASTDKTILLWQSFTGKLERILKGHIESVLAVSFSPTEKLIASASSDKTIKLWMSSSGELLRTLRGHTSSVSSVTFSPNGKHLASASHDGTVKLWVISSGKLLHTLKGHQSKVRTVSFNHNGSILASGSNNGRIILWDPISGRLRQKFKGHTDWINSLSFSPSGEQTVLASASNDKTIKLWRISSKSNSHKYSMFPMITLEGHRKSVLSLSFSPDGKLIASGSEDSTAKLWLVSSGQLLRTFRKHDGPVSAISFSPNGKLLASAEKSNNKLISTKINIWVTSSGKMMRTLKRHSEWIFSVSFSPNGKLIASASSDKTIKICQAQSGKLLRTLKGHSDWIRSVSFSSDGKLLASGSNDATIKIWDVSSGNLIRTLHTDSAIISTSFSPKDKILASGSINGEIKLWKIPSGKLLRTISAHSQWALSISFSPDGKLLASASSAKEDANDGRIKIWVISSGAMLNSIQDPDWIYSIAINPSGTIIASGSYTGKIKLWNMSSGALLKTIQGHSRQIYSIAFGPNGDLLASGSYDKTIKLWKVSTGNLLHSLVGHSKLVYSLAFSPIKEKLRIVSGSYDGTVKLWDPIRGQCLWDSHFFMNNTQSLWVKAGRLFRSDDATIVYISGKKKKATLLPLPSSPAKLKLAYTGSRLIVYDGERPTVAKFTVRNVSGYPAYRVRLQQHRPYYSQVLAYSNAYRSFLGKGQAIVLPMSVTYSHPSPRLGEDYRLGPSARREATISVSVTWENGTQLKSSVISIPILIQAPELTVASMESITNKSNVPVAIIIKIKNVGERTAKSVRAWIDFVDKRTKQVVYSTKEEKVHWKSELAPAQVSTGKAIGISYDVRKNIGNYKAKVVILDSRHPNHRWVKPSVTLTSSKHIKVPDLRVDKLSIATNGGSPVAIMIKIKNVGERTAKSVRAWIDFVDKRTKQVVYSTKEEKVHWKSELAPAQVSTGKAIGISYDVRKNIGNYKAKVVILGSGPYNLTWTELKTLPTVTPFIQILYLFIISMLLIFIFAVLWYKQRYRAPLLLALQDSPDNLFEQPVSQADEIHRLLHRTRRLEIVKSMLSITDEQWNSWLECQKEPVPALASVLQVNMLTRKYVQNMPELTFYTISLPSLSIRLGGSGIVGIVWVQNASIPELSDILRNLFQEHRLTGGHLLIVDGTEKQLLENSLRHFPYKRAFINQKDLTRIILSKIPQNVLARVIGRSANLGEISPYKTGGGIDKDSQFFGRRAEVALLTGRDAQNHLLIGARQMGKTSLLKAFLRQSPEVIDMVVMTGNNLKRDLEIARLPTLEELISKATRETPRVLLIDEADSMVKADRVNNYPLLRKLRGIAENSHLRFVLAGFWELHHSAYLEHQSPIRNLAESIKLGPLDEKSAILLATRPLENLGIRFESIGLVQHLMTQTGRRPNLIARVCDSILRTIPPLGDRIICSDLLRATLDISSESGRQVADAFKDISNLTGHRLDNIIDQMVMFSSVQTENFKLSALRRHLEKYGAQLSTEDLQRSLERLSLAYVVQKERGSYFYPVPLLKQYLIDLADGDADGFLELQVQQWLQFDKR